jgi:hypothetical protein
LVVFLPQVADPFARFMPAAHFQETVPTEVVLARLVFCAVATIAWLDFAVESLAIGEIQQCDLRRVSARILHVLSQRAERRFLLFESLRSIVRSIATKQIITVVRIQLRSAVDSTAIPMS